MTTGMFKNKDSINKIKNLLYGNGKHDGIELKSLK